MDDALARSTTGLLTRRLVWFAGLLFFLNYLDRVNVGFAALRMNQELGFTASVYGFGAGVFFVSYALLEIPSNLILRRVGPRLWLARIMISWGILSACFAAIEGRTGFYVLRFLLGAAEAGFVPGIVLYLTFWFPAAYRARAFATFFAASQLSSIIGAPLSGWILSNTQDLGGLAGWRWMFLLEGIPSVIVGIVILFYLPERPEQARFLSPEQRRWLTARLAADPPAAAHGSVGDFLGDIRVWTLTGIYFFYAVSVYGILFWLPQIIRAFGDLSPVEVGFLTSFPYVCALTSMLVMGRHSDRTGERRLHIAGCALLGAVALGASAFAGGMPALAYVLICAAAVGIWGQNGVFWALPTSYLGGAAAAGGIAFINCVAQFGGFFGPWGVGWIKDTTGTFTLALLPLAAASLLVALLALSLRVDRDPAAMPVPAR